MGKSLQGEIVTCRRLLNDLNYEMARLRLNSLKFSTWRLEYSFVCNHLATERSRGRFVVINAESVGGGGVIFGLSCAAAEIESLTSSNFECREKIRVEKVESNSKLDQISWVVALQIGLYCLTPHGVSEEARRINLIMLESTILTFTQAVRLKPSLVAFLLTG